MVLHESLDLGSRDLHLVRGWRIFCLLPAPERHWWNAAGPFQLDEESLAGTGSRRLEPPGLPTQSKHLLHHHQTSRTKSRAHGRGHYKITFALWHQIDKSWFFLPNDDCGCLSFDFSFGIARSIRNGWELRRPVTTTTLTWTAANWPMTWTSRHAFVSRHTTSQVEAPSKADHHPIHPRLRQLVTTTITWRPHPLLPMTRGLIQHMHRHLQTSQGRLSQHWKHSVFLPSARKARNNFLFFLLPIAFLRLLPMLTSISIYHVLFWYPWTHMRILCYLLTYMQVFPMVVVIR